MAWAPSGGGWIAELHVPSAIFSDATSVAEYIFNKLDRTKHPVLEWERFLTKTFSDESEFFRASVLETLSLTNSSRTSFTPVFSSQMPVEQMDTQEHFDHPFRAARKDYYLGNLKSIIENTTLEHLTRSLVRPWDYRDAMANQSLRLDHGDDRRHAYQWHAPTEDPARQKSGCMLGANRLAIESFPLFPCIPKKNGGAAVGFKCNSKTYTWITWPVWEQPCSLPVISGLLNLSELQGEAFPEKLRAMGIVAVFRSRRLPVEKNKVFLPPVPL